MGVWEAENSRSDRKRLNNREGYDDYPLPSPHGDASTADVAATYKEVGSGRGKRDERGPSGSDFAHRETPSLA